MTDQVHYTQYASFENDTIVVTNNDELDAALEALEAGQGGTILLSSSGNPYRLDIRNVMQDENSAILITSEDPNDQARIEETYMDDCAYITMADMEVYAGDFADERLEF